MRRFHWVWLLLGLSALLTACRSNAANVIESAEASWRRGDYERAIMLNREVIARDPQGKDAAQALLNIGNIYYRNLRQIRSAINTYNQVVQEFPGYAQEYQARFCLAEIYANELKDLTQAIAEYDKLLTWPQLQDPADIQFKRADLYFKNEDFDRALRELQRIEEAGVSGRLEDQVLLKIATIYQIQKRFEEALVPFQKVAQSRFPESRRHAIFGLMETYESLYDFDKAIEAIRKLDPSPENQRSIDREVARLVKKRRDLDAPANVLEWRSGKPKK